MSFWLFYFTLLYSNVQKVVFKVGEQELDTEWMVIKLPFIT